MSNVFSQGKGLKVKVLEKVLDVVMLLLVLYPLQEFQISLKRKETLLLILN